jgi:hypothetical protein
MLLAPPLLTPHPRGVNIQSAPTTNHLERALRAIPMGKNNANCGFM